MDARAQNGKSGTTAAILGKRRRVRRICHQTTRLVAPLFATKLRRKTMTTAIKWGLVAFVLLASAYVVETRAILALESSDSGTRVHEYAP
jgi:hypothetical protein